MSFSNLWLRSSTCMEGYSISLWRSMCFHVFKMCEHESHSFVSDSLQPHGLYNPWNSPGQNTGVGSHSLLQEIFPTQGSNPGLPHCRQILYQLSHKRSPQTIISVLVCWVLGSFLSIIFKYNIPFSVSCLDSYSIEVGFFKMSIAI